MTRSQIVQCACGKTVVRARHCACDGRCSCHQSQCDRCAGRLTEEAERRYSQRDDILCSINETHRGMAKARARGDAATFNYFLEKAGEHRRELADWKAEATRA